MISKNKRSYKNYIIPVILTLVILSVGVYASTVINNDYITQGSTTVNNSGIFYGGSKANVRTIDTVVCRGSNAADDLLKLFTCDVVCLSTESDCAAKITTALNLGRSIRFDSGVFPIGTTILFPAVATNIIIRGNGDKTILNNTGTGTYYMFHTYYSYTTFKDLTFNGNGKNELGILFNSGNYNKVENVKFINMGTGAGGSGVEFRNGFNSEAIGNTFTDTKQSIIVTGYDTINIGDNIFNNTIYGVIVSTASKRINIHNNIFKQMTTYVGRLIDFGGANDSIASSNIFDCGGTGSGDAIFTDYTGNRITVSNNEINACADTAIDIQSDYTNVIGNTIRNTGQGVIGFYGSSYCSATGNTVINAGLYSVAFGYGITQVNDTVNNRQSKYNIISGNIVKDNQAVPTTKYGIVDMDTTPRFTTVVNNIVQNATIQDILLQGTNENLIKDDGANGYNVEGWRFNNNVLTGLDGSSNPKIVFDPVTGDQRLTITPASDSGGHAILVTNAANNQYRFTVDNSGGINSAALSGGSKVIACLDASGNFYRGNATGCP